jgi:putative acetyltransferase
MQTSDSLTICREYLDSPVVLTLIDALDAELSALYPEPGANHFDLDAQEVDDPNGAFLVAYVDGRPVGCGAVRCIGAGAAEVKRMYARPDARSRGLGRAVLGALERIARKLGAVRLVLEAGGRQDEALSLYRHAGFAPIERFGRYADSPLSLCLGKPL